MKTINKFPGPPRLVQVAWVHLSCSETLIPLPPLFGTYPEAGEPLARLAHRERI
jgi:hypothetical protein